MILYCYENEKLSESQRLIELIKEKTQKLFHHKVYSKLASRNQINCFMSYHIFAVWNFTKLLKSLQIKTSIALRSQTLECSNKTKTLIEKIVFAEESELYPYGQPTEYFALYLGATSELEINPNFLWSFLTSTDNLQSLKPGIKELVEYNLMLAETGTIGEIAAAFLCGRESLTSHLFASMIKVLKQEGKECPNLISYTERLNQENSRQVETLVLKLLDYFCKDETDKVIALQAGLEALNLREQLWNYALAEITETT